MNAPFCSIPGDDDLSLKLSKLIRRLSSEHDGEVVATVRAIERTLKGAGHDLHKLADVVEQFGSILFRTAPVCTPRPSSTPAWTPPKTEPKPKPAPKWKNLSRGRQLAWLDILTIESKILCGGLPHSGYVNKFRTYRQHMMNGAALSEDEINLINRWIAAFFKDGARP